MDGSKNIKILSEGFGKQEESMFYIYKHIYVYIYVCKIYAWLRLLVKIYRNML